MRRSRGHGDATSTSVSTNSSASPGTRQPPRRSIPTVTESLQTPASQRKTSRRAPVQMDADRLQPEGGMGSAPPPSPPSRRSKSRIKSNSSPGYRSAEVGHPGEGETTRVRGEDTKEEKEPSSLQQSLSHTIGQVSPPHGLQQQVRRLHVPSPGASASKTSSSSSHLAASPTPPSGRRSAAGVSLTVHRRPPTPPPPPPPRSATQGAANSQEDMVQQALKHLLLSGKSPLRGAQPPPPQSPVHHRQNRPAFWQEERAGTTQEPHGPGVSAVGMASGPGGEGRVAGRVSRVNPKEERGPASSPIHKTKKKPIMDRRRGNGWNFFLLQWC